MKQIVDFSFRHWKGVVGVSVLLTLVFAYFLVQIKVDNSIETLSIDNDPKLLLLQESEKTFGGNEFIVISFKGEDIFSARVLSMIDAITTDIERIANVEAVLSLTNAVIAKKDESGFGMDSLVPESDRAGKDIQALKQGVISNRLYEKLLYSTDGNATSIIAWLVPLGKDDAARWRAVNAITDVLQTHKDDRKFYMYGLPVYQEIIYKIMLQDQIVLPILLSILMGFLLLLIFRNIWLVILPFGLIGITCLWTMGVFVMMGNTLDVVTFIITCVVLIVCLCDAVHILSEYRDTTQAGVSRIDHLKAVVMRIGPPIMLTSLTTAVGFCSLAASGIRCTRNFGLYTGLGVAFAFGASLTLIPIAMSVLPIKEEARQKNDRGLMVIEALLVRLAGWVLNHKGMVSVVTILVMVFCVTGALKLDANMKIFGLLKERYVKPIAEAQAFIDVELGGSAEFDVLLKTDRPGGILDPEVLMRIDQLQDRMMQVDGIQKSLSITTFVKELNQVLNDNDPEFYRIPDTRQQIDGIMMLYSMNEDAARLDTIINEDYSQARIRIFTYTAPDSVTTRNYVEMADAFLAGTFEDSNVSADFTGRPVVWVDMTESLIFGMLKTFSLAFVLIFGLMFVIFRSWRLGLVSVVINIIPVIVTFGVMGWMGISFNSATAMLPSIAIGIAVDDTIHFIWRFGKELRRLEDYEKAIASTFQTVGKPIFITTVLLCAGFAIFAFSRMTILAEFGLLMSLTVFGALLADLFVAPVLILILKPIKTAAVETLDAGLVIPEKEAATS